MYEITANVDVREARLCKMMTRVFEGYVKIAKDEQVEQEDGTVDFVEHKRRVMDVETIRAGYAFRMEVSRAMEEAGFKTHLGTVVGGRGLEELLVLERELKERAGQLQDQMVESLVKHGAETALAKCEVELVVLKLEAEEASQGAVDRLLQESIDRQLEESVEAINKAVENVRRLVETGNVPRAARQVGTVERELANLARRGYSPTQLQQPYADLEAVREALKKRATTVAEKLEALDGIGLMKGLSPRLGARPHLAAA
jgi:hypothetical protein